MASRSASVLWACLLAISAAAMVRGSPLATALEAVPAADPVRLDVYYESLCPDSIAFVENQLAVVYPELQDILVVDIFAYGKATDVPNAAGGYSFECQHGPEECAGNQMLACAKKHITDSSLYVDFNICVMSTANPPTAGEACAAELSIPYGDIRTCSTSVEGQQLLHEVGVATHALVPVVTYIPWMVVNDEHTRQIQNGAELDLLNFVCAEYQGITKPEACSPAKTQPLSA